LAQLGIYNTVHLTADQSKILNRDQTEEWRGWMQIIFLLYHYFSAKETYNFIRVLIACYVWMTGFGNFSFFWIRGDYKLNRFIKMIFRLNFFVVLLCFAMNKEYVLYYICPMHTFWFLVVYIFMVIGNQYNKTTKWMIPMKFVILLITLIVMFEIPGVYTFLCTPFAFFLNYHGDLREWNFRTKLDCYATLFGMICAYFHPSYTAYWDHVESLPTPKRNIIKILTTTFAIILLLFWVYYILLIPDKFQYNEIHRFTSLIPITCYLILRNTSARLRGYASKLFASIGKVTLETYLLQHHIWLADDAKTLTIFIPGYPLVNFFFMTILFYFLSLAMFHATTYINEAIFGNHQGEDLYNRIGIIAGIVVILGIFKQVSYTSMITN